MRSYTNETTFMLPTELRGNVEIKITEGYLARLSNGESFLYKDRFKDPIGDAYTYEDFNEDTITIYNNHIVSIKVVKVGIAKSVDYTFVISFKFLNGKVKLFQTDDAPSFRDYQENIKEYNQNVECVFLLSNSKFKN